MEVFFYKYLGAAKKDTFSNPEFINDLLEKKCRLLQKLMDTEDKDTLCFNALIMEYEKDKTLFQRQINRLKKERE